MTATHVLEVLLLATNFIWGTVFAVVMAVRRADLRRIEDRLGKIETLLDRIVQPKVRVEEDD